MVDIVRKRAEEMVKSVKRRSQSCDVKYTMEYDLLGRESLTKCRHEKELTDLT